MSDQPGIGETRTTEKQPSHGPRLTVVTAIEYDASHQELLVNTTELTLPPGSRIGQARARKLDLRPRWGA